MENYSHVYRPYTLSFVDVWLKIYYRHINSRSIFRNHDFGSHYWGDKFYLRLFFYTLPILWG